MTGKPDGTFNARLVGGPGRAVGRAAAEFRRGLPVVLAGADGMGLAVAVEPAVPDMLDTVAAAGDDATFVLTVERANALHILPSGHGVQRLSVAAPVDQAWLRSLADPTRDLADPLRGPFTRRREPPPAFAIAAVELCKIAHLLPAALVTGLDLEDATAWATAHDLLLVESVAVLGHRANDGNALKEVAGARLPLEFAANARIRAFRPRDGGREHYAILIGDPTPHDAVMTRLHSECFTGDLLGSLKCDCGAQLKGAIARIAEAGSGVVLYLAQEGRGIGLVNKLRAYGLQDQGFDTIEANERLGYGADERLFRPAAEILRLLGFDTVQLLTNNPAKVAAMEALGIRVAKRLPHAFPANVHNELYLETKRRRSGHYL